MKSNLNTIVDVFVVLINLFLYRYSMYLQEEQMWTWQCGTRDSPRLVPVTTTSETTRGGGVGGRGVLFRVKFAYRV